MEGRMVHRAVFLTLCPSCIGKNLRYLQHSSMIFTMRQLLHQATTHKGFLQSINTFPAPSKAKAGPSCPYILETPRSERYSMAITTLTSPSIRPGLNLEGRDPCLMAQGNTSGAVPHCRGQKSPNSHWIKYLSK